LPRHIAESVRLSEGQTVDVEVADEAIVVRPTRKRFKLADLLADYPAERRTEVEWGKPEGDEAW
jgi:antitoxin component of MazEF toxin-antitoxin module